MEIPGFPSRAPGKASISLEETRRFKKPRDLTCSKQEEKGASLMRKKKHLSQGGTYEQGFGWISDHPKPCSESVPSTPSWFGEVVLIVEYLRKHGILTRISEGVRFARRRIGHYEVIDFLAILFGYAISGERTLEAFYERLQPFPLPSISLLYPA